MRWLAFLVLLVLPQAPQQKFDPHDLSGHWNRTSRFQTFSNVPSGQGNAAERPRLPSLLQAKRSSTPISRATARAPFLRRSAMIQWGPAIHSVFQGC